MSIRLIVTVPLQEGETKEYDYVFQKDVITLGRHSRNDIQIPTPQVSAEHARIEVEGDALFLVDLGSQAGTTLDDQPLEPESRLPFAEESVIGIGGCTIRVTREVREVTAATEEKTQQVAMKMVREVLGAIGGDSGGPHLEVLNDEEQGQTVHLPEEGGEILVGREADCGLRLSHWSVSRHHARFRRTWDGVTVEDLQSKNGVMINETVIKEPKKLQDGDLVFVGHTQVRFHDPSDTLIDQLDDIPTPVSIDIKTTIIDLEDKKAEKKPEKKAAKKAPAETGGDAEPDTGSTADRTDVEPPPAKKKKRKKAPPPDEGGVPEFEDEDVGGGIGDYLFLIVGIVVILGVAAAAVFLFLL